MTINEERRRARVNTKDAEQRATHMRRRTGQAGVQPHLEEKEKTNAAKRSNNNTRQMYTRANRHTIDLCSFSAPAPFLISASIRPENTAM